LKLFVSGKYNNLEEEEERDFLYGFNLKNDIFSLQAIAVGNLATYCNKTV